MIFRTESGHLACINPEHVVAVQQSITKEGVPAIGLAVILVNLSPPNLPGATPPTITVRGDFRNVCIALGFDAKDFDAWERDLPPPEDDDIPF